MNELQYDIIKEYDRSLLVKFKKCGHTQSVNKEHIEMAEFICNVCSNLHGYDYFYNFEEGLQHKSNLERKCRICKTTDLMSSLIAIPQYKEDLNITFWFFHQQCIDKYEHTKESIAEILQDKTMKNKTEKLLNKIKNKKLTSRSTKPIISKENLKFANISKIQNNLGLLVPDTDVGFDVVNRTIYDIVNINGLCGIYSVCNLKNNRRYIGSTNNFRTRFKAHYKNLVQNKHHSFKIQNDFNLGNVTDFKFEILEVLDNDCLNKYIHLTEQKYMDLCDASSKGYNINPIAGFHGSANDYYELQEYIN